MSALYLSPLRVYVGLSLLALWGFFSGFHLPVSMFPEGSKPTVGIRVPYASLTAEEFSKVYGTFIENRLRALSDSHMKIASIETSYQADGAQFKVIFDWGTEQKRAMKEVEASIYGMSAQFPKEMRDRLGVWSWSDNQGFFAMSFYSEIRSVDELYNVLDPVLSPQLAQVPHAEEAVLWNPAKKEVQIELIPEAMAALQILPRNVAQAVEQATNSQNGGSLLINSRVLKIQMPRQASSLQDMNKISLLSKTGRSVHLQDLARVELKPSLNSARSFKTSGSPSLILFATPSPGGNIKTMSESILKIVQEQKKFFPSDVQMKVLVDPSEVIRQSIRNVFFEVILAASLAVIILFLFIGNLRNVITAAIEIPLSIVLAFILMRFWGININLISLGGLALSAGMNVDASVVVMENIFRHFDMHHSTRLSYREKWEILTRAVREVRLPIIASTVASVVVFLPLAMTSALTYSILGDLAKTVIFSHGFSAIVALILVPTIRLQLMKRENSQHFSSPIETTLNFLENFYISSLRHFLRRPRLQYVTYISLLICLFLLSFLVLPRLPKEIVGLPDTDWMFIALNTQGNRLLKQMEEQTSEIESRLLKEFGQEISYTFTQINGSNSASIMTRLKDKNKMKEIWKQYQVYFQNTPFMQFYVAPWNPSELPIPDPPHFRVVLHGGTTREKMEIGKEIEEFFQTQKFFSRVWQKPGYTADEDLVIVPHLEQWTALMTSGNGILPFDLTDISRTVTQGRPVGQWVLENRIHEIILTYPPGTIDSVEDLRAFPLGLKNKIIPLGALSEVRLQQGELPRFRKDHHDTVFIEAKQDKGFEQGVSHRVQLASAGLKEWVKDHGHRLGAVRVSGEDGQIELNEALSQLAKAIGLSVLLIFVVMVIQLGDIVSALLVLSAIPLGFIGVLLSLFIFSSTLSLNSALGVILLNGIAVANSIILVVFFNQLMREGKPIVDASLEAAQARLRPILMTSLTTTIGMLPIAIGWGEGGRVLQPLGVAVCGGLWISMIFTLYIVPSLQVNYWQWKEKKTQRLSS